MHLIDSPSLRSEPDPAAVRPDTGLVMDARFLDHRPGFGHPESPHRLEAVYALLQETTMSGRFQEITPPPATRDELLLCHSPAYLDRIAATARHKLSRLTADTRASTGSYLAACLAVGGVITAVKQVVAGELQNAMVLARPPGHHAEKSRAMGFCLFNNVALGAAFARCVLGLQRVLIVDWDLHHGNGIQHLFEKDPTVFYFSIHQYPLFPGTGLYTETGLGVGEGYTMNIPLNRAFGNGEYITLIRQLLFPLARVFQPDLILVAAGFDTHRRDPMGKMHLTSTGFAALTQMLMACAEETCHSRLVLVLEGGYHRKSLAKSIDKVARVLNGTFTVDIDAIAATAKAKLPAAAIRRCAHVHHLRWPELFADQP